MFLSSPFRPAAVLALVLATAAALPAPARAQQGTAGAFLAAREATQREDYAGALPYLQRLHEAAPTDLLTLERLVISFFAVGDYEQAESYATRLAALDAQSNAAGLVLLTGAFGRGDYAEALTLAQGEAQLHPLIDGLAQAWAHLGDGRMSEALEAFDAVAAIDGVAVFANYCRALALALVGDVEGALALLESSDEGTVPGLNRRGFLVYAQLLALNERYDDALAVLDTVFPAATDPQIGRMRAAYTAHEALPFDVITTPAQGLGEVFAVMADASSSAPNPQDSLVYARAAVRVNPAMSDAWLLIGQIFDQLGQLPLAAEAYGQIPDGDIFALAARLGQAQVLEKLDRRAEAIADLRALTEQQPQSFAAQSFLGDLLRRDGADAEAAEAYTRALALMEERGLEPDWQAYFARAVARSRSDDWPGAEADFRAALAIEPENSTLLNYLGYSLLERGEKLDEALDMIERAVAGEPDSGYILDSLAWARFRLGQYEAAVEPMEQAVGLEPTDAVLNDHLGDVYWAVGRQREARFQWRRALSFAPAEELDEDRLRRKLEVGLDAVRAEEGLPPLHAPE